MLRFNARFAPPDSPALSGHCSVIYDRDRGYAQVNLPDADGRYEYVPAEQVGRGMVVLQYGQEWLVVQATDSESYHVRKIQLTRDGETCVRFAHDMTQITVVVGSPRTPQPTACLETQEEPAVRQRR